MKPRILKRQILVIDDELAVRETLVMALGFDGHSVAAAASGAEALSLFVPGKFHLVLTDVNMPGMTGDKLAAEIKSRAPTQPVIAVSGFIESLCASQVPWFDNYLGKPFHFEKLRELIEEHATIC